MMRLKGKVAIITGATSGVGRAAAILFGREGAKVAVVGRRANEGNRTVELIKNAGGHAIFIKADVSSDSDVRKMVEEAIQSFQKVDILFNNAGINPDPAKKALAETSEGDWDRVIDVNLKGMFLTSKYVIPHLIRNKGGSIINTSSHWGLVGNKNRCVYITSKGGVVALTRSMAIDYASYQIRVNSICPAIVETDMTKQVLTKARKDEELWKEIISSKIPLGRPATPEDVAYAALFLASDESTFITGITLLVDGGYTAQ
jgi:NAD(P)-dependent dehydrogenase (short-subunit alcohol dehydrogenase family)